MGIKLAIVNQKGGVGKTTSTINLAAYLALRGKRTLLFDIDPQGNASSGLGINKNDQEFTTYDVLIDGKNVDEVLQKTAQNNLQVAPGNINLAGGEVELVNIEGREHRLKNTLAEMKTPYDFLLVDCPPSLGLLTLNALTAVDGLIIPIQAEYYALEGVSQLVETINTVKGSLNSKLSIFGVLMTMSDARTQLAQQVEKEVRNYFGEMVFNTVIPRNVRLSEAPSYGQSINLYDRRSKGAEAYHQLAKEVIKREKRFSNGR